MRRETRDQYNPTREHSKRCGCEMERKGRNEVRLFVVCSLHGVAFTSLSSRAEGGVEGKAPYACPCHKDPPRGFIGVRRCYWGLPSSPPPTSPLSPSFIPSFIDSYISCELNNIDDQSNQSIHTPVCGFRCCWLPVGVGVEKRREEKDTTRDVLLDQYPYTHPPHAAPSFPPPIQSPPTPFAPP